jgi:hypothetical protein
MRRESVPRFGHLFATRGVTRLAGGCTVTRTCILIPPDLANSIASFGAGMVGGHRTIDVIFWRSS